MRVSAFVLTWPRLLGYTLSEVSMASGLPLSDLEAGNDLAYEENLRLWEGVERLTGDPLWGLEAGSRFTLDQMGVVGPALAHCTHLDAALDVLVLIMKHFARNAPITRVDLAGGAGIEYRMPTLRSRHGADTLFAATKALVVHCTGKPLVPLAYEHQMPACAPERYRAFFGLTPVWDQPSTRLLFAKRDLALPFRGASAPLASLLREQAGRLLAGDRPAPSDGLEDAFWRTLLEGDCSLAKVAEAHGVSERTLQRNLAARGETFRGLRARLLQERAQVLLNDESLSLDAVAARLGFASRSAFSRAYSRWTGASPRRRG